MSDFKAKMLQNPKFSLGSAPDDPAGEAYSAPQTPYLDLRGPTSKRTGVEVMGGDRRGREGRGR